MSEKRALNNNPGEAGKVSQSLATGPTFLDYFSTSPARSVPYSPTGSADVIAQTTTPASRNILCTIEVVTPYGPYFSARAIAVEIIDSQKKKVELKFKNASANSFFFTNTVLALSSGNHTLQVSCQGGEKVMRAIDFFANDKSTYTLKINIGTFVLDVPYVNQRFLDKSGDAKCGPSSLTMVLSYQFKKFGMAIGENELVSKIVNTCFELVTAGASPINKPQDYKEGDWLQYKKQLLGNTITFWSRDKKFSSIYAYKNANEDAILVNSSLGSFWTWPFLLTETAKVVCEDTLKEVKGIVEQVRRFIASYSDDYKKYIALHLDYLSKHSNSETLITTYTGGTWASMEAARTAFVELLTSGNPIISGIVGKHYFVVTGFKLKDPNDNKSAIEYLICNDPFGNRPNGTTGAGQELNVTAGSFKYEADRLFKYNFYKGSTRYKKYDELIKSYLNPNGYGVPYTERAVTYTRTETLVSKNEKGEEIKTNITTTHCYFVHYFQIRCGIRVN